MTKHIKISSIIFLSSFIIQLLIFMFFFNVADYVVFPSKNINIEFYTDSSDNGKSIITSKNVTDSSIVEEFILKKGFVRPYSGMTIRIAEDKYVDITHFNEIQFIANGYGLKNIEIYLITINNLKSSNDVRGDLHLTDNINIGPHKQVYTQKFSDLKLPDWWYDANNVPRNTKIKPDLKHLKRINFTSGFAPELNIKRSLGIYSIKFVRNNSSTITFMLILQIGIGIILLLLNLFFIYRSRKSKPVIINYVPIEVEEREKSDDFMTYINANFSNSSLSLENVATNTAVSQRTITEYISTNYKCNFKTYINQLRINEAKRLLMETSLNISEIAFKVGFSSPNHFNRVFKNLTGDTPSGFLQREKS